MHHRGNMRRSPSVGLMLSQHLRRWTSIKPASGQRAEYKIGVLTFPSITWNMDVLNAETRICLWMWIIHRRNSRVNQINIWYLISPSLEIMRFPSDHGLCLCVSDLGVEICPQGCLLMAVWGVTYTWQSAYPPVFMGPKKWKSILWPMLVQNMKLINLWKIGLHSRIYMFRCCDIIDRGIPVVFNIQWYYSMCRG